jgi:hypothetical protein
MSPVASACLAQAKHLFCPENGGPKALHFLVENFSFLGFDAQYWMVIDVAVVAGFVLRALATRSRN